MRVNKIDSPSIDNESTNREVTISKKTKPKLSYELTESEKIVILANCIIDRIIFDLKKNDSKGTSI